MPSSLSLIAALAIGYLLGSIPFGVLITRFAGVGDLRAIGSGNIGATNVLRTGRRDLAAATLVADCLKGTVAVLVASALFGPDGAMLAGLGAFLGHVFPVWLRFKGGKGVATYLGVLIGLALPSPPGRRCSSSPWPGSRRRISPATPRSARWSRRLVTPLVLIFVFHDRIGGLFVVLTVILWWRHADNIRRLLAGTESRIGAKK